MTTPLPSSNPWLTDTGAPIAFDVPNPFILELVAGQEDLDPQGHVNNAVYVRWMDRAAFAHSEAVGYDWAAYQRLNSSFVVRRHEIDYLAPAFAGDRILVATWPCRMEKVTALRRHQFVRQSDGRPLIRALTTWVYLDTRTGRPIRIPTEMIEAFGPHQD